MDIDDVAVRIMEEDLIPAGHSPCTVIAIMDFLLFQSTLESLDVVHSETIVAAIERVDGLFHAEGE